MKEEEANKILLLTLQGFLEHSQDMIFIKDVQLNYIAASNTFLQRIGYSKGHIEGKTDFDCFEADLAQKYITDDKSIIKSGQSVEDYIEPLPEVEGKKTYSSTSKYLLRDIDGNIVGLYGIARDVTAQVELEAERESRRLSRQAFDIVLEADLTENRMSRTEGGEDIPKMNIQERDSYSETMVVLAKQFIHTDYREAFLSLYDRETLQDNYAKGVDEFQYLVYADFHGKGFRWMQFSTRVYHSRVSNTLRMTVFLKDVDEEVLYQEKLKEKATTDALTGLHNRGYVLEQIADYLYATVKNKEEKYALFFVDLDDFKQVNDRCGHQYGDNVLKEMAKRLTNLLHHQEIYGRIGGDEFLIFQKGVMTKEDIREKAEQLLRTMTVSIEEKDVEIQVTCSVGIAFCSGEHSVDILIQSADRAMYRAKERGKNQLYFYDEYNMDRST